MGWHWHRWSKWSEPLAIPQGSLSLHTAKLQQRKHCRICNKVIARWVLV